jgi:hypothetical protein
MNYDFDFGFNVESSFDTAAVELEHLEHYNHLDHPDTSKRTRILPSSSQTTS